MNRSILTNIMQPSFLALLLYSVPATAAIQQIEVSLPSKGIEIYSHNGVEYFSTNKIINTIKSQSVVYGYGMSKNTLNPMSSKNILDAQTEHQERVKKLAIPLHVSGTTEQGWISCNLLEPLYSIQDLVYIDNLYQGYYAENTFWYATGFRSNYYAACNTNKLTASGYMTFHITYTCPKDFYFNDQFYINDPKVPDCLMPKK